MKEMVTFFLSGKEYGVNVTRMQGIENYSDCVVMPGMPENLQGFVTIRGDILPLIDIKKYFHLPKTGVTADTKYMVLRTTHGNVVIVADGVSKIIKADGNDVQEFPKLLQAESTSYVEFVVKNDNHLILSLDAENFLNDEEWECVRKLIAEIETGGNDD